MNLVFGVLIVIGAGAVASGALLFVRRTAPEGGYFNDSDRAAGVFGVLATGFAILLGFIVFLAFASYDQSRSGAEAEAQMVLQQYQTAQFLPDDEALQLTGELVCYGRYVVEREWPALEDGELGDAINPWSIEMFVTLQNIDPQGPTQETAFDTWLDQTSQRQEARQDRVHGAEGIMPSPLWIVLIAIGLLIFAYMLLFADSAERSFVQAAQIGSVVMVITATMLVIQLLNQPFQSGPGGIEPVAMERALGTFEELSALDLGVQGDPPCSDTGDAL